MPGPAVDGVRAAIWKAAGRHARPLQGGNFAAGGALNARRRVKTSLQYLWKSRCLLGY